MAKIRKMAEEASNKTKSAVYWNIMGIVEVAIQEQRQNIAKMAYAYLVANTLTDQMTIRKELYQEIWNYGQQKDDVRAFAQRKEDGEDG